MRYSSGTLKEPETGNIMEPVFALPLTIPARNSGERLQALHGQLRAGILEGRLRPGLRLPSTRALADSCGVSRNTAMAAYDLLLSEGYVAARQGAGTYVADVLPDLTPRRVSRERHSSSDRRLSAFWRQSAETLNLARPVPLRFDFRLGVPDIGYFPMDVWRRLSSRALRAYAKTPVAYGDSHGRPALREAIARYVSFARAVACQADDITYMDAPLCQAFFCPLESQEEVAAIHPASVCSARPRALMEYAGRYPIS
jgi:GntR family transcriptional regulator/MocR family aminotransferase